MLNPEDITDPTTAMNILHNRNVENQNGYKAVQNVRNQVVQNAVQNPGVQNVRNQNGLIVVSGIANQNPNGNINVVAARDDGNANRNNGNQIRCYICRGWGHLARNYTFRPRRRDAAYLQTQLLIAQKEEARIQLQAEEFNLMAAVADLDEIEEVNENCILMANLQRTSTPGSQTDKTPVYDLDRSAEYGTRWGNNRSTSCNYIKIKKSVLKLVKKNMTNFEIQFLKEAAKFVRDFKSLAKEADESLAKHKTLELEIERLLRAVVSQDIMSIVQNPSVVDSSNLQTELDRTKERLENCIIKKENEYVTSENFRIFR
ncbi:hypothetical protein Tco_1522122 [Tanacetum coccineum]